MGVNAVIRYMASLPVAERDTAWKRIQAGFILASELPTTPSPRSDLDAALEKIFGEKTIAAQPMHASCPAKIGGQMGKKLHDWLDPILYPNHSLAFLRALADSRWVVRGEPEKSKLIREMKWGGRMFGAFTSQEVAVLEAWICDLNRHNLPIKRTQSYEAFTGAETKVPVTGVTRKWSDILACPSVPRQYTSRLMPTNFFSPLSLQEKNHAILSLLSVSAVPFEYLPSFPAKCASTYGMMAIRCLRALYGFLPDSDTCAGMNEVTTNGPILGVVEIAGVALKDTSEHVREFVTQLLCVSAHPERNEAILIGLQDGFIEGCSKEFCLTHLTEHQQMLNEELNHIINDYDEFKQRINEQKQNPQNHSLIKQIDQWERRSIELIQQKAQDCRENLVKSSQTYVNNIEKKFNDLCEQIKQIHAENEFNEINLNDLRNQLNEITEELNISSNISIHQESQSFINEISIISSKKPKFSKWKQTAITVAAGNGQGQQLNQLNHPAGIFIDKNKNIFIADRDNHRIVEWKYNANEGQTIAGENKQGNRMHQLGRPTDVIVDEQNHSIVIADLGNRRVIQWMNQNQQVLNQNINCQGLAINKNEFLYVSDSQRNEVIQWKMGDNEALVVAGGNGQGNKLNQLDFPTFIFVDEDQSVYVSDFNNHRVMKWRKGAKKGKIVAGGNGEGRN
ncbi:unnamed protein product, partial [Adineta steineri]